MRPKSHDYLSRLRDADGNKLNATRFGAAETSSPHGRIMDVFGIETASGERFSIYMDMYHPEYNCIHPFPGFRLLFEHDERYEYIHGKISTKTEPSARPSISKTAFVTVSTFNTTPREKKPNAQNMLKMSLNRISGIELRLQ